MSIYEFAILLMVLLWICYLVGWFMNYIHTLIEVDDKFEILMQARHISLNQSFSPQRGRLALDLVGNCFLN
ncbi:hypothetical protein AQUCO_01500252v1 [Aquilegia coerulea]|uniref:Uncharacterized protein n=1 Tax=Aquilegia coerulea TaxID=218851 RepID=A0A2G5DSS5_AQUCA|nr:hypothetical protein AQUCO_01500252v1 [Aquilegia coerulea]